MLDFFTTIIVQLATLLGPIVIFTALAFLILLKAGKESSRRDCMGCVFIFGFFLMIISVAVSSNYYDWLQGLGRVGNGAFELTLASSLMPFALLLAFHKTGIQWSDS